MDMWKQRASEQLAGPERARSAQRANLVVPEEGSQPAAVRWSWSSLPATAPVAPEAAGPVLVIRFAEQRSHTVLAKIRQDRRKWHWCDNRYVKEILSGRFAVS
jgi:hypothetical protein